MRLEPYVLGEKAFRIAGAAATCIAPGGLLDFSTGAIVPLRQTNPAFRMQGIDFSKVTPCGAFVAENPDELELISKLLNEAKEFVGGFTWCRAIVESYVGFAIGSVIGVFLFKIEPGEPDVDEWLWVVVGDLPPAYLVTEAAPNAVSAVECYIDEMSEWVEAVREGRPLDDIIPVTARGGNTPIPPNRENAEALNSRLWFLRERVLPEVE